MVKKQIEVTKCDICSKIVKEDIIKDKPTSLGYTFNFTISNIEWNLDNNKVPENIDMCNDCHESFKLWRRARAEW